jgi:hypothetical protein
VGAAVLLATAAVVLPALVLYGGYRLSVELNARTEQTGRAGHRETVDGGSRSGQ